MHSSVTKISTSIPIEIPDSRIHDLCSGCKQWFFPDDGSHIELRKKTGLGRLQRVGDLWTGVDRSSRFTCFICQEKRKRRRRVCILAVVLGLTLFSASVIIYVLLSGILDRFISLM